MIAVGLAVVALALLVGLFEAHVGRLAAWDRPRWTLTRSFAMGVGPARVLLLVAGLVILLATAPAVAACAALALVSLRAWLAWARSDRRGTRILAAEVERRRRERPDVSEHRALREIVLERHPRWGDELVDRILADHPDPRAACRMIVRMEREARR